MVDSVVEVFYDLAKAERGTKKGTVVKRHVGTWG